MPCGILTLDHVSYPSIWIECLKLFQNNNNNYILNNQILKHVATHHLPSILTKIVAF
jgi:hypothetical protein